MTDTFAGLPIFAAAISTSWRVLIAGAGERQPLMNGRTIGVAVGIHIFRHDRFCSNAANALNDAVLQGQEVGRVFTRIWAD